MMDVIFNAGRWICLFFLSRVNLASGPFFHVYLMFTFSLFFLLLSAVPVFCLPSFGSAA